MLTTCMNTKARELVWRLCCVLRLAAKLEIRHYFGPCWQACKEYGLLVTTIAVPRLFWSRNI